MTPMTPYRTTPRIILLRHLLDTSSPYMSVEEAGSILYNSQSLIERKSAQKVLEGMANYGLLRPLASGNYKLTKLGREFAEGERA